jgi:hypothetical protein
MQYENEDNLINDCGNQEDEEDEDEDYEGE